MLFRAVLVAALAMTTATHARTLTGIMLLEGSCGKLNLLGVDASNSCIGKLTSNVFDDGRASFTYLAEKTGQKPVLITFSGQGRAQIKQSEDLAVQPVDLIVSNVDGRPVSDKAVGYCMFSNPYRPTAIVNCIAETADGRYEASFGATGGTPKILDPRRK